MNCHDLCLPVTFPSSPLTAPPLMSWILFPLGLRPSVFTLPFHLFNVRCSSIMPPRFLPATNFSQCFYSLPIVPSEMTFPTVFSRYGIALSLGDNSVSCTPLSRPRFFHSPSSEGKLFVCFLFDQIFWFPLFFTNYSTSRICVDLVFPCYLHFFLCGHLGSPFLLFICLSIFPSLSPVVEFFFPRPQKPPPPTQCYQSFLSIDFLYRHHLRPHSILSSYLAPFFFRVALTPARFVS